ncbi:MAG: DUF1499 domain-containing protein [Gammaproteobacteria bacterium]|nr:MAG: DUF1499 domain-containing protein [Gammaproteobacteria bacterium]
MQNQIVKQPLYKPAMIGFSLIILAILTAMTGPIGSRLGWWDFDAAVLILKWSAYTALAASVLCLSGLWIARPGTRRRGFIYSLLGLFIVIPMILFLQSWKDAKKTLPPIQDITTNTENPPSFWYAPNSRIYGGIGVAVLQQKAYPDIEPLLLSVPIDKAYDLVVKVIRGKGWQLYPANKEDMHIEATETTFWFGFSDDVTIHITATENGGSQIDMRSASRFGGGGDGGTNARRIRSFFKALKQQAE